MTPEQLEEHNARCMEMYNKYPMLEPDSKRKHSATTVEAAMDHLLVFGWTIIKLEAEASDMPPEVLQQLANAAFELRPNPIFSSFQRARVDLGSGRRKQINLGEVIEAMDDEEHAACMRRWDNNISSFLNQFGERWTDLWASTGPKTGKGAPTAVIKAHPGMLLLSDTRDGNWLEVQAFHYDSDHKKPWWLSGLASPGRFTVIIVSHGSHAAIRMSPAEIAKAAGTLQAYRLEVLPDEILLMTSNCFHAGDGAQPHQSMPRVFYYITELPEMANQTYVLTGIDMELPAMIAPAPK